MEFCWVYLKLCVLKIQKWCRRWFGLKTDEPLVKLGLRTGWKKDLRHSWGIQTRAAAVLGELRWCGHLVRELLIRLPDEVLQARPSERRHQARSRTRWRDYVPQNEVMPPDDLEIMPPFCCGERVFIGAAEMFRCVRSCMLNRNHHNIALAWHFLLKTLLGLWKWEAAVFWQLSVHDGEGRSGGEREWG